MKTIIEVTAEDIAHATAARKKRIADAKGWYPAGISDWECPIALSLLRKFPEAELALASADRLKVLGRDKWQSVIFYARSTATIRRFMRAWDRHWKAVPTRFRVEVEG